MVSHSRFGSCVQAPLSNIEEYQHDGNSDDDSEDDVEMRHEDAKDFEPDAAYGTYGGFANTYDAEALTPLEVDRSDTEPIPVKEETALVVERKQRPRKRICNVALAKVKTQADLPMNFDDIAPAERSPQAESALPPAPPPLPPPAPSPTNIVSVGVEPKSRGEAPMVISLADGSHARHYDDNPLSKLLLSHRDSSTAEVVAKAM